MFWSTGWRPKCSPLWATPARQTLTRSTSGFPPVSRGEPHPSRWSRLGFQAPLCRSRFNSSEVRSGLLSEVPDHHQVRSGPHHACVQEKSPVRRNGEAVARLHSGNRCDWTIGEAIEHQVAVCGGTGCAADEIQTSPVRFERAWVYVVRESLAFIAPVRSDAPDSAPSNVV